MLSPVVLLARRLSPLGVAKITAVDQVAVGNVVVAEGTIAGTHSGTFRTPQGELGAMN